MRLAQKERSGVEMDQHPDIEGEMEPTPQEKELFRSIEPLPQEKTQLKESFLVAIKDNGVRKEIGEIGPEHRWGRTNNSLWFIILAVIAGLAFFFLMIFLGILS